MEMKPSIFSSSGRRLAAMSRYSCLRPSAGQTSNMIAIICCPLLARSTDSEQVIEERFAVSAEYGLGAPIDHLGNFTIPLGAGQTLLTDNVAAVANQTF